MLDSIFDAGINNNEGVQNEENSSGAGLRPYPGFKSQAKERRGRGFRPRQGHQGQDEGGGGISLPFHTCPSSIVGREETLISATPPEEPCLLGGSFVLAYQYRSTT